MFLRVLALTIVACAAGPCLGSQSSNSVALRDVMKTASHTTHLNTEITLQLYRTQLKKDNVDCAGRRHSAEWKVLSGSRLGPYECTIGGQKLIVRTTPVYFDGSGHMIAATDADLKLKAVRFMETGIKWSWQQLEAANRKTAEPAAFAAPNASPAAAPP